MLKNILLQFTDLYNMTCVYCREEDKLSVCIKTTPSCIQKKKLKLCFCVWTRMTWPRISESSFPLKYHAITLERQLNYVQCFATMSLWQSNDLIIMLCYQSFLVQCLLSTYWKLFPFLESIWFFSVILNHRVFDKFIQFKSCVKSASHYFTALMVSSTAKWRAWPWQCVK